MQVQPINNRPTMIPQADGLGRLVVMAEVVGLTVAENQLIPINVSFGDVAPYTHAKWTVTAFLAGGYFELVGVALTSAPASGGYIPVAVFGPVENVTLPANVTRTTTNSALVRGGTRTARTNTVIAGPPTNVNAVADITDSKTGAANGRDLFLYGKNLILETLFRSTGRVKDNTGPLSQSMLMDGDGNGYLMVDATDGLTEGRLTLLRRGRTTSWKATYNGANLGDAVTDGVFIYGVPTATVAAASGAVGRVQVLGTVVNADVGVSVTAHASNPQSIYWTSGNNTLTFATSFDVRTLGFVHPGGSTGRRQTISLYGYVFSN